MFLTRSEYDRGVNTFSPEGRLFQVEYAMEAVKLGTTTIGIQSKEGIVLVAERRAVSRLLSLDSIKKISKIDKHIVAASAGLIADARTWVDRARTESQDYFFTYGQRIGIGHVTMKVSEIALHFGDDESTIRLGRPFGVAMLFAGVDHTGTALYHLDPSGTYIRCIAKAIGAGGDGAEQALIEHCKECDKKMTLAQAQKVALTTLKQLMEEKISNKNVEIVIIKPEMEDGEMTGKITWLNEEEIGQALVGLE
uniref:Proteasome subunit alpha type n=1 Tax=Meloidogyne enterolobii TaxID=390850 RepID=A0A6V7TMU3_MELEN|nr:unnamed protein product [Meloidogyne enterolobii]CAD2166582.1 unnamed protein product [Meloidogyne enterolobii]